MIVVDTVTLPAAWASFLVNNDNSGLTRLEQERAEKAVARLGAAGWRIVSTVEDSERFTHNYAACDPDSGFYAGDVLDYTVHRHVELGRAKS